MDIRNVMEDLVKAIVDELFEAEARERRLGYCTCEQCKHDVACYVLNRVKPEYIVSSRGLAYSELEGLDKVQRQADVISLVQEGWGKVSHAPRQTAVHEVAGRGPDSAVVEGPAYNFPTIMGRVFDGRNFAPLGEGRVRLLEGEAEVPMIDPNWQNPFILAGATAGTYIFWPRPVPSSKHVGDRRWNFEIRVEVPSFDLLSHFAVIELSPEREVRSDFSLQRVYKIPDLYLFPEGQGDEEI